MSEGPYTVQGDVYAMGVLYYQLVVGDLPRPLGVGWERDVGDELLREDIAACVDIDIARRLPSASELAARVRSVEARRSERVVKAAAIRAAELRQRRRRLARIGVTGALVLLAIVAGATAYHVHNVNAEKDRTKTALGLVKTEQTRTNAALVEVQNRKAWRHEGTVNSAAFSPDGTRVVTADGGSARLWDVAIKGPDAGRWLADLDESRALKHLDERGTIGPLDGSWKPLDAAQLPTPAAARWVAWFTTDVRHRTISPFSDVTVDQWLRERVADDTRETLQEALNIDPNNALCLALLAGKESPADNVVAERHAARAVQLAPTDTHVLRESANAYRLIGDARHAGGDAEGSLIDFVKFQELFRRLDAADPAWTGAPPSRATTRPTKFTLRPGTGFWWVNTGDIPRGLRIWQKLDDQTWQETWPNGHKQQFRIVTTDDPKLGKGWVVRRLPDEKQDVWVPAVAKGGKTYFRAVGGSDEWHFMSDTKPGIPDIEFPLPMPAATQPTTRP